MIIENHFILYFYLDELTSAYHSDKSAFVEELKTLQSTIKNLENRIKGQNNSIEDLSKKREELESQLFSEKREKDSISRYIKNVIKLKKFI